EAGEVLFEVRLFEALTLELQAEIRAAGEQTLSVEFAGEELGHFDVLHGEAGRPRHLPPPDRGPGAGCIHFAAVDAEACAIHREHAVADRELRHHVAQLPAARAHSTPFER